MQVGQAGDDGERCPPRPVAPERRLGDPGPGPDRSLRGRTLCSPQELEEQQRGYQTGNWRDSCWSSATAALIRRTVLRRRWTRSLGTCGPVLSAHPAVRRAAGYDMGSRRGTCSFALAFSSQCNNQADAGVTTTTCDITITNIITYNADGTLTTASTIVKTVDGLVTTTTATAGRPHPRCRLEGTLPGTPGVTLAGHAPGAYPRASPVPEPWGWRVPPG